MHSEAQGKFSKLFVRVTEPIVFGHRGRTLAVLGLVTLFMVWEALHLKIDSGFEKQLPLGHPYIQVFKQYEKEFGGANLVLFAVTEKKEKDIYNPAFMSTLRAATDSVTFLPGTDRARVSSIYTPDVRYLEVVEDGFAGGNVISADFTPTPENLENVKANVSKAGIIGRLVANDQRGAMIFSELLEQDPITGKTIDYIKTAELIEEIRQKYLSPKMYELKLKADREPLKAGEVVKRVYKDPRGLLFRFKTIDVDAQAADGSNQFFSIAGSGLEINEVDNPTYNPDIDIAIIGFAKVVGDVADSIIEVVGFFGLTLLLTWFLLTLYTGSALIALIPLSCAVLAVIWELGLLHLFGYALDPFGILVPFLVLSIGVSHGIQITSFWLFEVADHGLASFEASRATYRRLVVPGISAVLTNVVGFGTILLVPIGIVQEMAVNAMFGLIAIIFCKKMLLPCLLSYAKISNPVEFRAHQARRDRWFEPAWNAISKLTLKPYAIATIVLAVGFYLYSDHVGKQLKIGELHEGVPELRPDSRYNRDSKAVVDNFAIGVDVFKVIAESKADGCIDHAVVDNIDRFAWRMENTPGVQSTLSLPKVQKKVFNSYGESNPKWNVLPRESGALVITVQPFPSSTGLLNENCSAIPVFIFTADHKAETIDGIVAAIDKFNTEQPADAPVQFKLATGNVGVMAAVNDVVAETEPTVLFWVYAGIALCVFISFRTVSSVICILFPLALVSVMSYAVMVWLEIGIKVSTLPVAAFAAGIGVDYGIYIYSVLEECVKNGMSLRDAYKTTLHQTGKAVVFTSLALAGSVCTWLFSGLQFQVDMGVLLTIMFLANAVAAVLLLPAFAFFLLKPEKIAAKAAKEAAAKAAAASK
ncbi:MMPL family transporter [uncultured Nevskia sp.]|uniref:efflux RND transporter permease subunit n=1 Tax=uncultured Nevskia sp. TaxID=228950 RepID=UPI0025FF0F89|nr:MMPL family transporter [uncultured Nevskia sp.]